MFNKNKDYSQMLGLSKEGYDRLLKRLAGYYATHNVISKKVIGNGFYILEDLLKEEIKIDQEKRERITRNIVIREYMDEIIKLRTVNGYGAVKIIKTLVVMFEKNDPKVTTLKRSTLEKFLRDNDIEKGK